MKGRLRVIFTTTQGFITNLCSILFSKICGWTGFLSTPQIRGCCRKTAEFSCKMPKEREIKAITSCLLTLSIKWLKNGKIRIECEYHHRGIMRTEFFIEMVELSKSNQQQLSYKDLGFSHQMAVLLQIQADYYSESSGRNHLCFTLFAMSPNHLTTLCNFPGNYKITKIE